MLIGSILTGNIWFSYRNDDVIWHYGLNDGLFLSSIYVEGMGLVYNKDLEVLIW